MPRMGVCLRTQPQPMLQSETEFMKIYELPASKCPEIQKYPKMIDQGLIGRGVAVLFLLLTIGCQQEQEAFIPPPPQVNVERPLRQTITLQF